MRRLRGGRVVVKDALEVLRDVLQHADDLRRGAPYGDHNRVRLRDRVRRRRSLSRDVKRRPRLFLRLVAERALALRGGQRAYPRSFERLACSVRVARPATIARLLALSGAIPTLPA